MIMKPSFLNTNQIFCSFAFCKVINFGLMLYGDVSDMFHYIKLLFCYFVNRIISNVYVA